MWVMVHDSNAMVTKRIELVPTYDTHIIIIIIIIIITITTNTTITMVLTSLAVNKVFFLSLV